MSIADFLSQVSEPPERLLPQLATSLPDGLMSVPQSLPGSPQTVVELVLATESSDVCTFHLGQLGQPTAETVTCLMADLAVRGMQVVIRDGRLFVAGAEYLTDEDRLVLRACKPALIAALTSSAHLSPPEAIASCPPTTSMTTSAVIVSMNTTSSLASFLGTMPVDAPTWHAQEPPSLDGIDEIVLNFATTGLRWQDGDRPIGVTVSTLDGQMTRFLPFAFKYGGNLDEEVVKRWAQREVRGKKITNANTRFDVHMSREWGVDLEEQGNTVSDVMHYAALLDDHRKFFALDVLAADYLPDESSVARLDERRHADYAASEVVAREIYTAQTVVKLRHVMWPQLDAQELQQVRQIEDDVIFPVVEMEKNGSLLDVELLERYHKECGEKHQALMMEIVQEANFAFEHTASGWKRLLEHCRLSPPDSFSEEVLNQYDHPFVRKAQKAAQYASLDSKTFAAYLKLVDSKGVMRYDINQLRGDDGGTVSGRFSIGYVQQVPNADNHFAAFGDALYPRRLFIAAQGDYLEADARQIEYRLFAHFAENETVIQAYRENPLMSFHEKMWEMVKRYKPDMLYSHQKSFDFAKQYGAKVIKLAVMLGFITEQEAAEIREAKRWDDPRLALIKEIDSAFGRAMPEVDQLLNKASHLAKSKCDDYCKKSDKLHRQFEHRGYVKTIIGRRSRFPNNYKTYIGLNRVLQGSGADIMKRKVVELHRERRHTGLLMRLTVHDAVAGDAQQPETKQRVTELLNEQSFSELKVPILWAVGTGRTWAECK